MERKKGSSASTLLWLYPFERKLTLTALRPGLIVLTPRRPKNSELSCYLIDKFSLGVSREDAAEENDLRLPAASSFACAQDSLQRT
jgi:hypothetical protein